MNTIDDFVDIVRDEIGIPVTADTLTLGFDELPGWDSVHLLSLVMVLERETGRRIAMLDVLEASSLKHIYGLATTA